MKGKHFTIPSLRLKYVVTDFILTSLAFFCFNIVRFYVVPQLFSHYSDIGRFLFSEKLVIEQFLVPICIMGIYWLSGYYNTPFPKSRVQEFSTTFWSAMVATMLIFLVLMINDSTGIRSRDYEIILICFMLLVLFTYSGRLLITNDIQKHLKQHKWIYSTLIVGNSEKSREVFNRLQKEGKVWSYSVVGFIRLSKEQQVCDDMPSWDLDMMEQICRERKIDQVILAPQKIRDAEIMHLLKILFPLDIPVRIAPDTLSYITSDIHLNDILGIPFINLTSPRISEFEKNVKRSFDVMASVLTMIFLSPILAVTALCVKFSSEGPVIYRQERIGRNRKPFYIYKFRSMYVDAEKNGPRLSSDSDTRITPFGKIMRKYRIDELPQFWNVLRGDMSLVGPRPEREFYIKEIIKRAPYYGLIFQVRPGVTSWGMVKYGYASSVDQMVQRSKYDLIYLNNMSITTDIKIMIYTVRTVLKGSGM